MPNLLNVAANEDYYSGELSKIARQLGFVGLGVIWIFKTTNNQIPPEFLPAAAWFVVFFALDFAQYLLGYVLWFVYRQNLERNPAFKKPDGSLDCAKELDYPDWMYAVIAVPFWLKFIPVIIGYVQVLMHFLPETSPTGQ